LEYNIPLEIILSEVSTKCSNCNNCVRECAFLQKYGTPKEIADRYDPRDFNPHHLAFECSLCCLCEAVCPEEINPCLMFLAMRREAIKQGTIDLKLYKKILNYEKRGISKRYTYYNLPNGGNTIFFPGCALPGTRPDKTLQIYHFLKSKIKSIGIVLDCCATPSHNLGRQDFFEQVFFKTRDFLLQHGIKKVFVACPNCHEIFRLYGGDMTVNTVYEFMADQNSSISSHLQGEVTIHDPCALRFEDKAHEAVRKLVKSQGLNISEMVSHGLTSLCCGEGGTVEPISPQMADQWKTKIKRETQEKKIVTYCAGCVKSLNHETDIIHVLDLVSDSVNGLSGRTKISSAPITYLNRLWLKHRLKKENKKGMK
jgi:Fe-S oxidoreductase